MAQTSPEIRSLGVSQEELDAIQKSRLRRALMSTITSPDFPRRAVEAQFMAMVAKSDDRLRALYVAQLDGLIQARMAELASLRAAFRNVTGRAHGTDPVR